MRRTTVAGALSFSHSSRSSVRSELRILSTGRMARRVARQMRAMDCSEVWPFFVEETSAR
ncbi:Uncharacterised protein [Achromobacter sp. 2789STDY5608628]|nr:Uncharacterised protein [Achromobacter sp. 2789STDY5608628]